MDDDRGTNSPASSHLTTGRHSPMDTYQSLHSSENLHSRPETCTAGAIRSTSEDRPRARHGRKRRSRVDACSERTDKFRASPLQARRIALPGSLTTEGAVDITSERVVESTIRFWNSTTGQSTARLKESTVGTVPTARNADLHVGEGEINGLTRDISGVLALQITVGGAANVGATFSKASCEISLGTRGCMKTSRSKSVRGRNPHWDYTTCFEYNGERKVCFEITSTRCCVLKKTVGFGAIDIRDFVYGWEGDIPLYTTKEQVHCGERGTQVLHVRLSWPKGHMSDNLRRVLRRTTSGGSGSASTSLLERLDSDGAYMQLAGDDKTFRTMGSGAFPISSVASVASRASFCARETPTDRKNSVTPGRRSTRRSTADGGCPPLCSRQINSMLPASTSLSPDFFAGFSSDELSRFKRRSQKNNDVATVARICVIEQQRIKENAHTFGLGGTTDLE